MSEQSESELADDEREAEAYAASIDTSRKIVPSIGEVERLIVEAYLAGSRKERER